MKAEELVYTEDHEWIEASGEVRTVGISDHAQHALGDIVFADLPEVGRIVTKGEELIVVESTKAASDVYAPMSGEVVEINPALDSEPGIINTDPYGDGWLVKIKIGDPSEADSLLSYDAYQKTIGED